MHTIPESALLKSQQVADEEYARAEAAAEKAKAGTVEPDTVDLEAVSKVFEDEAKRLAAESAGTAITTEEQV